ncbi:toll/interleukin-1 receptor domain-containing protein [Pseudomonas sp. W15Feb9B]|uniref:toll/interleukin-1 receptor domain-containing protein n=1 Tax=Pseudomonas sp. W15Feb9B TaxID=550743 RepID=UPI000597322D|nr:toll/interleukin-1 receptor domain-containing protein [Pseudomonas sp. W15Feb9B]KIK83131.1 molecular chaperone Tir [Pseudomonas sp. W15Feb9B]
MSIYELAILGCISPEDRKTLTHTIHSMVSEFGLALGTELIIHDGVSFSERNIKAATAVAYFGGNQDLDHEPASDAITNSLPIIPTIAGGQDFLTLIPEFLHQCNGLYRRADDPGMVDLATSLLECVGLLRRQRRIFISYRRTESRIAALDLHDSLIARGFDVFLDTHDIRPGEPFQEVLWHRLCDSDVLVMLDTPNYFESKWTRNELGRARAKEIHIFRILWPGHVSNRQLNLSETIQLVPNDLMHGSIVPAKADEIALGIERLRSRSIAARFMSMTGRFRSAVEQVGGTVQGVGAHRAISVVLEAGERIWAYPITGIPTAETLHDIAEKARRADVRGVPVLVYDDVGIRDTWVAHLKWLDDNIRTVRSIKMNRAAWDLGGWEEK